MSAVTSARPRPLHFAAFGPSDTLLPAIAARSRRSPPKDRP
jgi:hypothetical protein